MQNVAVATLLLATALATAGLIVRDYVRRAPIKPLPLPIAMLAGLWVTLIGATFVRRLSLELGLGAAQVLQRMLPNLLNLFLFLVVIALLAWVVMRVQRHLSREASGMSRGQFASADPGGAAAKTWRWFLGGCAFATQGMAFLASGPDTIVMMTTIVVLFGSIYMIVGFVDLVGRDLALVPPARRVRAESPDRSNPAR